MPWWGKSSKDGKRKARKGCVVDTVHGKLRVFSEEKGLRFGSSSVIYQHPSTPLQASCYQSFSGNPIVQPVSLQGRHPSTTRRFYSENVGSKRTGRENFCQPSLLSSFAKPGHIVDTPDGKYIDMEFMTASVSTYNSRVCDDSNRKQFLTNPVPGHGTSRKTATNCSSRLKLKDKSAIPSKKNSRDILRPSNSLLNKPSVSISPGGSIVLKIPPFSASFIAPSSSISNPLVTPRRVIRYQQFVNSGISSGKSHANTSLLSSGHHSTPGSCHTSGQSSVGDVPELIYRQHGRCSPESSPTVSPTMASAGTRSRFNSLHPLGAGASPETHILKSDDRNRQSHKLPLPPVRTSSPVPTMPSSPTSRNSQNVQSSVEADNLPSPGPRWKKGLLLGRGTFGHVYLGFNNESGDMCAMKEVTLYSDDPKSKESAHQLCQEIALLSRLRHPNIVQYYGSEMVDDNIYIYLEYVSGGSIHKVLQVYGPLREAALRSFTKQILSGLAYLHAKNTVHRDVKGANILLQPGGCVKLADFGMAKHITGEIGPMSFKGSPYWIAPEVIRSSNADVSVDIWSLGCTLIEMATGKPPWSQYEGVAALFKISNSNELPPIPDSLSEEGKDFIRKCLQRDPLQRPTAAQLLEHPFVKSSSPLERHTLSPEPVEAMHLATNSGNLQSRNPQFLDPGAIHQIRDSRTVTPIRNAHSPKNTASPVSSFANLLPQQQSPRNMSAAKLTPILTSHGASGSSIPNGPDVGAIQFHSPRTPQHMSERLSPTSISTPRASPSASIPISVGNVRPSHHSQSPKHRCDRLSPSLNSSPHAASSSSAHLAEGNVSFSYHTKSPTKNMHGHPISMSWPKHSSYPGPNTSYHDVKPGMFQQVPHISHVTTIHSSVKRDQNIRNFLENRTESELDIGGPGRD